MFPTSRQAGRRSGPAPVSPERPASSLTAPAVFVDVTSGPLGDTGNGIGAAWGDYDNDGDLDLYLSSR